MFETILLPMLVTFAFACILGPILIPLLRKLKVGNTERKELESHQVKNGTPSMGGFIFLGAITISMLIFGRKYPDMLPIYLFTMASALIGFLDDFLKVVLKRSDGLLSYQKFLLQVLVTGVFAFYMWNYSGIELTLLIPFSQYFVAGGYYLNIGVFAIPLMFLAVIGTSNGVNFTDGVDGLLSTVTLPVSLFFVVASVYKMQLIETFPAMVIGGLLGYLIFNVNPARIFMGDTGSLALGGYVAAMAYYLRMPLFIIIIGFVYLTEVISVMIQVSYFKYTKKKYGEGRRVFKMTPIHHHFELSGFSETQIVAFFAIFTTIMCVIAFAGVCGGKL